MLEDHADAVTQSSVDGVPSAASLCGDYVGLALEVDLSPFDRLQAHQAAQHCALAAA